MPTKLAKEKIKLDEKVQNVEEFLKNPIHSKITFFVQYNPSSKAIGVIEYMC